MPKVIRVPDKTKMLRLCTEISIIKKRLYLTDRSYKVIRNSIIRRQKAIEWLYHNYISKHTESGLGMKYFRKQFGISPNNGG